MNMLMKSMREATPQDGMFDSEQTRMYTSMLDQQLSQKLASRGIGLADMMVHQLSRTLNAPAVDGAAPEGQRAGLPLNVPRDGLRVQRPARRHARCSRRRHGAVRSSDALPTSAPLCRSFCRMPRRRAPAPAFPPAS